MFGGLELCRQRSLNEKLQRIILLLVMLTRASKPHINYIP